MLALFPHTVSPLSGDFQGRKNHRIKSRDVTNTGITLHECIN